MLRESRVRRGYRIEVSTSRCGRDNLGSIPSIRNSLFFSPKILFLRVSDPFNQTHTVFEIEDEFAVWGISEIAPSTLVIIAIMGIVVQFSGEHSTRFGANSGGRQGSFLLREEVWELCVEGPSPSRLEEEEVRSELESSMLELLHHFLLPFFLLRVHRICTHFSFLQHT